MEVIYITASCQQTTFRPVCHVSPYQSWKIHARDIYRHSGHYLHQTSMLPQKLSSISSVKMKEKVLSHVIYLYICGAMYIYYCLSCKFILCMQVFIWIWLFCCSCTELLSPAAPKARDGRYICIYYLHLGRAYHYRYNKQYTHMQNIYTAVINQETWLHYTNKHSGNS